MRFQRLAACMAAATWIPLAVQAADTFASTTFALLPGTVPGDFPGKNYGGDIFGVFPVALDDATARSYALGSPDGRFLSLPGQLGASVGSPFPGAYIEVGFGSNFGLNGTLNLFETGDNDESARLFLWTDNGGSIQVQVTRGISDEISIDLGNYAVNLAAVGGTSFTKVGIGGLDLNGVSKGFDLDAVSITPVPEPETFAMMLAGLGIVGWMARHRRSA